jgi:P63C domain
MLDARDQDQLTTPRQLAIAKQCEILVRGFARVGIIALVDEATGYQKDRARDSLAKILEAFVAKEMQPYVQKFPAVFYEEMFRLRGLPFDPKSVKRPPYFGHLTNDIVYRRLAPGVWKELKSKAKRDLETRASTHLHRHLTSDIGDPRLKEMLTRVTTVMQLSSQWEDFKDKLDRVAPAFDETLKLPFELEDDSGNGI